MELQAVSNRWTKEVNAAVKWKQRAHTPLGLPPSNNGGCNC
jgi:hypothetical protein